MISRVLPLLALAGLAARRRYRGITGKVMWDGCAASWRMRWCATTNVQLVEALEGGTLVLGGRAADAVPLPPHPGVVRLGTMAELAAFARVLAPRT